MRSTILPHLLMSVMLLSNAACIFLWCKYRWRELVTPKKRLSTASTIFWIAASGIYFGYALICWHITR